MRLVLGATTPPGFPLPLIFLLVILGSGWLVSMVLYVRWDKKWQIKRGKAKGTEGRFSASFSAAATVSPEDALRIAKEAITAMGGREITQPDDWSVIGWTGSPFTNVPKWAEYELVVQLSTLPDGAILFTCSTRRRNPVGSVETGRSQELAWKLRSDIALRGHAPR